MGLLMASEAQKMRSDFDSLIKEILENLDKLIFNQDEQKILENKIPKFDLTTPYNFFLNFKEDISKIKLIIEDNLKYEVSSAEYLKLVKTEIDSFLYAKSSLLSELSYGDQLKDHFNTLKLKSDPLHNELETFVKISKNFRGLSYDAISKCLADVQSELKSFNRLRNIADNAKTEEIYNNAVDRYRILEADYRQYFYWGVSILVTLSFMLLITKPYLPFEPIEFWILKGSTLLVGITLLSYFLKQSTHYQKLADQNYQIQVELQAYPSFMDSVPTAEAAVIRKELALKYFGKEIDGSPHKDMSNLMSDQMKNSTELVKAATNILKKQ